MPTRSLMQVADPPLECQSRLLAMVINRFSMPDSAPEGCSTPSGPPRSFRNGSAIWRERKQLHLAPGSRSHLTDQTYAWPTELLRNARLQRTVRSADRRRTTEPSWGLTMTLLDRNDLIRVSGDVRRSIERLSEAGSPATRRIENILSLCCPDLPASFPSQWCDFASCVLGGHLNRITRSAKVDLVVGQAEGRALRHWWLRYAGYNIDITCDQFPGAPRVPFVDRDAPWHKQQFADQSVRPFASRPLCAAYFERALVALECRVAADPEVAMHGAL